MTDAAWIRSTLCIDNACTEVTFVGDMVWVRNSKAPSVVVRFTREEWAAFLGGVRLGELDGPPR